MRIWLIGNTQGPLANIPEFEEVAERVRERGHEPVFPQDVPPYDHSGVCAGHGVVGPSGHSRHCLERTRISAMLACDAVITMPGWNADRFLRNERRVAALCGLQLFGSDSPLPALGENPDPWREGNPQATLPGLIVGGEAKRIIEEIKNVDFPNELPDDEDEDVTPEEKRVSDAYSRGLSDGEDAFWRKLGAALVANGHSERCAAVKVSDVASAGWANMAEHPISDKIDMKVFALRMRVHGEEYIKRQGYHSGHETTAREVLRRMVLFVTGREVS